MTLPKRAWYSVHHHTPHALTAVLCHPAFPRLVVALFGAGRHGKERIDDAWVLHNVVNW